ncbi:hypothetical protein DFJ58DRAFT_844798 [Suillus subalutaceus]|uniref:uncharacterized protein n=1 Tax=Suillus subalutaceus TaxID=48586 RepID=UPI001B8691D9|nr:uncharacterized protein DFJ58DRAFT_844798 [Suillus subalutaceus]KAG1842001.1 hypothetical protein DFJ58DRAFT_844798 [Suillus subalutaceus]
MEVHEGRTEALEGHINCVNMRERHERLTDQVHSYRLRTDKLINFSFVLGSGIADSCIFIIDGGDLWDEGTMTGSNNLANAAELPSTSRRAAPVVPSTNIRSLRELDDVGQKFEGEVPRQTGQATPIYASIGKHSSPARTREAVRPLRASVATDLTCRTSLAGQKDVVRVVFKDTPTMGLEWRVVSSMGSFPLYCQQVLQMFPHSLRQPGVLGHYIQLTETRKAWGNKWTVTTLKSGRRNLHQVHEHTELPSTLRVRGRPWGFRLLVGWGWVRMVTVPIIEMVPPESVLRDHENDADGHAMAQKPREGEAEAHVTAQKALENDADGLAMAQKVHRG